MTFISHEYILRCMNFEKFFADSERQKILRETRAKLKRKQAERAQTTSIGEKVKLYHEIKELEKIIDDLA